MIHGDATDLVGYLNKNAIQADLIVSYDVIEHVYDVKENFQAFGGLEINPEVIVATPLKVLSKKSDAVRFVPCVVMS